MNRNSMLRLVAAGLPFFLGDVAVAQQASLPPAAAIVAKYGQAIGATAILGAKSIVTKGGMSMPSAGINATFEMTQLGDNLMSMTTTIPGMGTVEAGYDGTTAWSVDPMQGPRILSGPELDQIRDEADRRGMVRSAEMFTSVQTVADTTMNSERCYLVKLTWKSGRETYDCFSVASGLMVASRSTQKTSMGDIPVVSLIGDYRKFGDITVATKTVQELMGQQQILTISSVETGDGAGLTVAPPAAVKAMVKPPAK